jgi:hypothetical protein
MSALAKTPPGQKVSKHIEIKATTSIRHFLTECKKVTDARLLNKITKKEIRMRTELPLYLKSKIQKISLPH